MFKIDNTVVGLVIIIFAWFIQLFQLFKGKKEISACFLLAYMFGCLLIALDGFANNLKTLAWLNIGCVITACLVLAKVGLKCCCCSSK